MQIELLHVILQELQLKLEEQEKATNKEQQKEKRCMVKLQHEIGDTDKECQELTSRIKVCKILFLFFFLRNGSLNPEAYFVFICQNPKTAHESMPSTLDGYTSD